MKVKYTKQQLIDFESKISANYDAGKLPYCIHLSGGNEDQLINIFKNHISEYDWVFSTWRSHYHYLLKGGSKKKLMSFINSGNSMHIFDKELKFFTSAIVGGCLNIAVGVALSIKRNKGNNKVIVFCGDGAEDQGCFYEAARYIDNFDLPCDIVVEDNNLSVDTPSNIRNGLNKSLDCECIGRYYYKRKYPHVNTGKFVKYL
jgi:TPP-dependent pyruvate/acetoin dehydrogenase alpha subunit